MTGGECQYVLLFTEELNNIISQELPVCLLQEVTGALHHHSLCGAGLHISSSPILLWW